MRINHNIAALNTHRQLNSASNAQSKSMEKLSSGLRINRAGDDAAGLAISEKMRAQIRGLDQASSNSQDGISMIQTAEGALNETHDILQRMRELATQAANDTNVGVDRGEIQKEINQLSSEINRVGNTTEFNTQALLKGNGTTDLKGTGIDLSAGLVTTTGTDASTVEVKALADFTAVANGNSFTVNLNGESIALNFTVAAGETTGAVSNVQNNSASVSAGTAALSATSAPFNAGVADALQQVIDANEKLAGNYKATVSGGKVLIEAVKEGNYAGSTGNISYSVTGTTAAVLADTDFDTAIDDVLAASVLASGKDIAATATVSLLDLNSLDTDAELTNLVGKGMTIGDQQIEFYDSRNGSYSGDAQGIDISDAFEATTNKDQALVSTLATQLNTQLSDLSVKVNGGDAGKLEFTTKALGTKAEIKITDGTIQEDFKASFQVGANKNQSFTIDIKDMRSDALGITGKAGDAGFTATNSVTDGTSSTNKEAALDVSSHTNASAAIETINKAIETVSSERSKLGAFQNRLEHTINNLNTSSENLTAAESRIRDVDMAKEMMTQTKNSILAQAAQAMLAQANQQPQGVLQLLR